MQRIKEPKTLEITDMSKAWFGVKER